MPEQIKSDVIVKIYSSIFWDICTIIIIFIWKSL